MSKRKLNGYQGIFFDRETMEKLIALQDDPLTDVVPNMHITFQFGIEKFPDELVGKEIAVILEGYASDGKNSGFSIHLPDEVKDLYKGQAQPHITVSLGEVEGEKGKPVDTGKLVFSPLEKPEKISGKLGYFIYGKGIVYHNDVFHENDSYDER